MVAETAPSRIAADPRRPSPVIQVLAWLARRAEAVAIPLGAVLVGLALLTPPLAGIFQLEARIGGVPFTALYLFFVWAALIAGAALLSRRLHAEDAGQTNLGLSQEPRE